MGSVRRLIKNGRVAPDSDEECSSDSSIASTKSLVAKVTKVNALEDAESKFGATKAVPGNSKMTEMATSSKASFRSLEHMFNVKVANRFGLLYEAQVDMEVQTRPSRRLTSPPGQPPSISRRHHAKRTPASTHLFYDVAR
ncbi:hypothetical protein Trydic_g13089 [Trypoxylus dichotomus]